MRNLTDAEWEAAKEQARVAGLQKYPSQAACDAVDGVLKVHREIHDDESDASWCDHCAELSGGENWDDIKYPCLTVRVIRQVLPEPTRTIHTNGEGT